LVLFFKKELLSFPRLSHDQPANKASAMSGISPIEPIIKDARNGMPYIMVGADDRETESAVDISRLASGS